MTDIADLRKEIFRTNASNLHEFAMALFRYQSAANPVYSDYLHFIDRKPSSVDHITDIPFLPAELFKSHHVVTGSHAEDFFFESSGTTGMQRSRHYVADIDVYRQSIARGFHLFFGEKAQFRFLFLLPDPEQNPHSSLLFMCDQWIRIAGLPGSGFYLNREDKCFELLRDKISNPVPTILFGVSHALLGFAEKYDVTTTNLIVMETGGMKGKRPEITREELHQHIRHSFHVGAIYSEYGMTELLSMAFSETGGIFFTPPWMKILIRDPEDPFTHLPPGATGCINVIDLANINSCSFIATQDLGRINADGSFEVLGRYDKSDIRGCNLLLE